MSLDIFLFCVRDGEQATFERSVLEDVFGPGAIDPQYPLLNVKYGDGGCSIIGADDDDIDCLMFEHFGGDTFYSRLWELADRTGSFFIWTERDRSIAVTNPQALAQIYRNIGDDFGKPFVVRSGKELEDAIEYEIDAQAT